MSEKTQKIKKKQLDMSKLQYTDVVPEKRTKSTNDWLPVLKNLQTLSPPKNILMINETEASIGSIHSQILKCINKHKLNGFSINRRTVDKKQTIFISYKKQ